MSRRAWAARGAVAGTIYLAIFAGGCGRPVPAAVAPYEVAYTATGGDGAAELFLADLDGGRARRVSGAGEDVSGLEWSPDGERLAYATCEGESSQRRCTLYTVAADGSDRQRLGEGAWPHWSPDGRRIAFVKPRGGVDELYVTDRDRDAPRLKTAGLEGGAAGGGVVVTASPWSPDGRMLAVTRRLEGGGGSEAVLVRGDGQLESRVGGELTGAVFGGWSPDGGAMLLLGALGGGNRQLFVAASDGSGLRAAVEAPGERSEGTRTAWSPDGALIAIASEGGVAVLDAATLELRLLASGACEGAGGVEWASAATIWFTRGCDERGRVLVERDFSTGTERAMPIAALEFARRPG